MAHPVPLHPHQSIPEWLLDECMNMLNHLVHVRPKRWEGQPAALQANASLTLETRGICSTWELALYKGHAQPLSAVSVYTKGGVHKIKDSEHDRITSWVRVDVLVLSPRLIIMADGEHHTGMAGRAGRDCPNAA